METGTPHRHSKVRTIFIIIPILVVLVAAGIFGFSKFGSLFAQEKIEPGVAVTVTIPTSVTTASQIASILKDAHVISDTQTFINNVRNMNAEQSLKPGTYNLETLMDQTTLINLLVAGPVATGYKLTIPEGLTVEQTAAIVETTCGIPQADFMARANAADEYVSDYPFLAGAYNNSLEGFLYPDTYDIPVGSSADYVIRVLLDQFALETKDLDLSYAQSQGLNILDVVTIASLIERETASADERPLVSSVIYNRLNSGWKLQIDATVVYALGPDYDGHPLLNDDLEVDSPYNTYQVDGLPAGPICSPRLESIQAAAQPADTNYFYYVLTSKDGTHTFCETEDEFNAAKAVYESVFGIQ